MSTASFDLELFVRDSVWRLALVKDHVQLAERAAM